MNWDAWDIDWYFEEQFWPLDSATVTVAETGPHRAALRIERRYRSSRVVQVVSLAAGARQVEFDTWIDWHERQTVLKAAFPAGHERVGNPVGNPVRPCETRHPPQHHLGPRKVRGVDAPLGGHVGTPISASR